MPNGGHRERLREGLRRDQGVYFPAKTRTPGTEEHPRGWGWRQLPPRRARSGQTPTARAVPSPTSISAPTVLRPLASFPPVHHLRTATRDRPVTNRIHGLRPRRHRHDRLLRSPRCLKKEGHRHRSSRLHRVLLYLPTQTQARAAAPPVMLAAPLMTKPKKHRIAGMQPWSSLSRESSSRRARRVC